MHVLIFQHIACEKLGTGAAVLEQEGIELRVVHLYDGEVPPPDWASAAGLVFLGGPMNVYQEQQYPFLKTENEIIKEAIRRGKPTLGLCLGAQLIAKAAGARVYAGRQKEIGWYPVCLTPQAQAQGLLAGFPSPLNVFQWHGDTFDLPPGATPLGSSDLFANQGFCLADRIYALQFHLEVNLKMIEEWLEEYQEELSGIYSPQQIEGIRRASRRQVKTLQRQAQTLFQRFARLLPA